MRDGHAWHRIVKEARKCALVCCRCHREIHAGITSLPENYTRFNEEYADIVKLRKAEFDECICGQEKHKRFKFCSTNCSQNSQRQFVVTKSELEQLIKEYPYETIGKMFNVSGNSIRKRCKKFGIKLEPKRGYWAKKRAVFV